MEYERTAKTFLCKRGNESGESHSGRFRRWTVADGEQHCRLCAADRDSGCSWSVCNKLCDACTPGDVSKASLMFVTDDYPYPREIEHCIRYCKRYCTGVFCVSIFGATDDGQYKYGDLRHWAIPCTHFLVLSCCNS